MKLPRLHLELPAQGFKVLRVAQWALVLITAGSLSIAVWMLGNSHLLESDALRLAHAAARLEAAYRPWPSALYTPSSRSRTSSSRKRGSPGLGS